MNIDYVTLGYLLIAICAFIVIFAPLIKIYRPQRFLSKFIHKTDINNSSIILSLNSTDTYIGDVTKGKIDKYIFYHYTLNPKYDNTAMKGLTRYSLGVIEVAIKQKCPIHIFCYSTKSDQINIFWKKYIGDQLMEIRLEGDFPDYFHIFVTQGNQIKLLELFDPAFMSFLIDFCNNFDFEIYDNSIFASQHSAHSIQDNTSTIKDVVGIAKTVEYKINRWIIKN